MTDKNLIAPCGLYCGACSVRFATKQNDSDLLNMIAASVNEYLGHPVEMKDLECDGCLSDVVAVMCRECKMRDCVLSKGLKHCSECGEVPCQKIIDFQNDGMVHHSEVVKSIHRHREIKETKWEIEQEERWRCEHCGETIHWYAGTCKFCGEALKNRFE
jgi:hypothetical protein